jgi:hypothetical protein
MLGARLCLVKSKRQSLSGGVIAVRRLVRTGDKQQSLNEQGSASSLILHPSSLLLYKAEPCNEKKALLKTLAPSP